MTETNRYSTRRGLLAGATTLASLAVVRTGHAQPVVKEIHQLRPGEFTWHPERSPAGPVAIIASIPDQRVYVYRNGIRIAVSTCSTGKPGHETPTGVFTVLQKDKNHRSSTYSNAPMPNMNRLTWSGIALHAGKLPGYPASHGCIRLPMEFSRLLFTVTHVGTPVILAGDYSDPAEVAHPGMVLSNAAAARMNQAVANLRGRPGQTHEDNSVSPLSILISGADRRAVVFENGDVIAAGGVTIQNAGQPLGSHVFMLANANDGGLTWHGIGHHANLKASVSDAATLARLNVDDRLMNVISDRLHVGTVLTTVDLPLTVDSSSRRDFVIVNGGEA